MTTRPISTEVRVATRFLKLSVTMGAALVTGAALLSLAPARRASAQVAPEARAVAVADERTHTVTYTIAPLTIPVTGAHHEGPAEKGKGRKRRRGMGGHDSPFFTATWPVQGWLRGFSVELYDSAGVRLPRTHLHHVSMVNLGRRQLVLPAFERILGAGQEQSSFRAPGVIGVPMEPGMELGTFIGWHNDTGAPITGAKLIIRMDYTRPDIKPRPTEVFPVWLDVNYRPAKSDAYDLAPGPSSRSFEFTVPVAGRILAAGGHMHDYARFIRLEDAGSGEVLFTITPRLDERRRLVSMPRKIFGARGDGIKLQPGRRYRIRADYDSPEPDTLKSGAMGIIVLLYHPDDVRQWPTVDLADRDLQVDLTWLETMGWPRDAGEGEAQGAHQH